MQEELPKTFVTLNSYPSEKLSPKKQTANKPLRTRQKILWTSPQAIMEESNKSVIDKNNNEQIHHYTFTPFLGVQKH